MEERSECHLSVRAKSLTRAGAFANLNQDGKGERSPAARRVTRLDVYTHDHRIPEHGSTVRHETDLE